ncbi:ATP-binding protein [Aeromicrobium sp. 9AM]|uniref:ATP-binding protein n=1 Tax=Aeromicrobium sp. 9AM TaxID=2653126 RepID=UPI00135B2C2A|nr:ATP-binding protein [Aeromicrobium sp. 9AM]
MQITHVKTVNIAGLSDTDLSLPSSQLLAFAGANGTGKSKLMACLLVPWTRSLPPSRDGEHDSVVEVTFEFTSQEIDVIESFDRQMGWGQGRPEPQVTIIVTQQPLAGLRVESRPNRHAVHEALLQPELLKRQPSLNLIYLPAERRLLPPQSSNVDLEQLTEDLALSKLAEARNSVHNFGRLDDQEFESYAKALCVAGALPSEAGAAVELSRWESFKASVDALLFPKVLLPLTRENPSHLRIQLPGGETHPVHELSSGERQALIIVSRVFRAGEGHSLVAIDEPDAYLHPALSSKLLQALRPGLGTKGSLMMATHSPSILDSLPPDAIVRLSYTAPPSVVESESDRLALYREAGFRASTLTQADALLVTEGDFDVATLPQLLPILGSVGLRSAGGRAEVLKTVATLSAYDLPIVGVVDADVRAVAPSPELAPLVHVWPAADIEGVLLADDQFLTAALEGQLVDVEVFPSIGDLKAVLQGLLTSFKDNAIAELAQRILREQTSISWPSPRGADPIVRLNDLARDTTALSSETINDAVQQATEAWNSALPMPWTMVRGKWILNSFVQRTSAFKNGDGFVNGVLARQPRIAAIDDLGEKVRALISLGDANQLN